MHLVYGLTQTRDEIPLIIMTDVDTFETQSPGVIKPCAAPRKNNFNLYKGVRFYCSEMIVCGMHCNGGGGAL